jgi:predicted acetyltransferase
MHSSNYAKNSCHGFILYFLMDELIVVKELLQLKYEAQDKPKCT